MAVGVLHQPWHLLEQILQELPELLVSAMLDEALKHTAGVLVLGRLDGMRLQALHDKGHGARGEQLHALLQHEVRVHVTTSRRRAVYQLRSIDDINDGYIICLSYLLS